jgi:small subunit ribosomal protein S18
MACYFCQRNIKEIDFKNTEILHRFISGLGKIRARKRTGVCSKHQRQLSRAIKRARHLGLLAPTKKE